MSVLVFADVWDPHADKVCAVLESENIECHRVDLDVESLRQVSFSLADGVTLINLGGRLVNSLEIKAVWARRLNVALSLQEEHFEQDRSFQIWRNEWNRHLYWVFDSLRNAYWLNELIKGGVADNKHIQMRFAREAGLQMPPTISTNDKNAIISFCAKHEPVALKFISQKTIQGEGKFLGIYVNKLKSEDFNDFGGADEQPVVLQRYIEKDYEVRYTYVSGKSFVCKIESQRSSKSNIDWRRYDLGNTPHSAIDPPDKVSNSVKLFMSMLGVDYGALDFVVDKEGNWWFLELNSNGQWLWIEELTGLPISVAIANLLRDRAEGR